MPIVQGRSENRHVSLTTDSSNPLRPTTRTDVPAGIAPSAAHKDQFGVEPICRVLEIAPSTYYAAASRPPCARQLTDEALKPERPIAGEITFAFGRLKRTELPAVLSGCSQAQALQRSIVVFREQGDRDVSGFVMTA